MNAIDILVWGVAANLFFWTYQTPPKLAIWRWSLLGLWVGIGLLNKMSVLWLLLGLLLALLSRSSVRRHLFSPGPYLGLVIAIAVSSPFWVWERNHDWLTVEFTQNAIRYKMTTIPFWLFWATQIVVMNPINVPMWAGGVVKSLKVRSMQPLGVVFVTVAGILLLSQHSRPNYISPACIFVVAPGAVWIASCLQRKLRLRQVVIGAVTVSGLCLAPLCMPILPASQLETVLDRLPHPPSDESGPKSALQGLADMIGWPELTLATEQAFEDLSPDERKRTVVITNNYGEAAALEHFGHSLPRVICLHNEFWLIGPADWDGRTALLVNPSPEMRLAFKFSKLVGRARDSRAVPEERRSSIWLMKDLRMSVPEFWVRYKKLQ